MSDGDNATPGDPSFRPDPRLDRAQQVAYPNAAAGARRRAVGAAADAAGSTSPTPTAPSTGNHTDGVTVADLFARLTGEIPAALQQHRDTEPGSGKPAHGRPDDVDPPTSPCRRPTHRRFPTWMPRRDRRLPTDTEVLPLASNRRGRRSRPQYASDSGGAARQADPETGQPAPQGDARRPCDRRR